MFPIPESNKRKNQPRLLPGLTRSSSHPEIKHTPGYVHSPSIFKPAPELSYDSNKSQESPSLPKPQTQPSPFGLQRVNSLNTISKMERINSLDKYRNSPLKLSRFGSAQKPGSSLPAPTSLFAFRQDSLRGSRIVRIPSGQELPKTESVQSVQQVPVDNGILVIPFDHISEEENRDATHEEQPRNEEVREGEGVIEIQEDGGRQHEGDIGEAHEIEVVEDEETDEESYKTAVYRVGFQFLFNVIVLFCYGAGFMFVQDLFSVEVIFGLVLGMISLYLLGLFKTGGYHRGTDTFDMILSIGNAVSLMIYATAAFCVIKGYTSTLAPFSFFGFLVIFATCCKNSIENPSPTKVLLLVFKVVAWVELFLVGLRVEGVSMPWATTFIPLYFTLMIMVLSSMLMIIGSLFAFFSIMSEEGISAKLLIGSVWYILNALYTAMWLAIISQVVQKLDKGKGDLDKFLIAGVIHGGVLFFFTLIFWKILCKFQEFEVQSEMLGEEHHTYQEDLEDPTNMQIKFQVNKEDKTKLVMISSTFYTLLSKHMKSKNTKEVENLKKEAERAKLGKARRTLKVNAPQNTDHGHHSINIGPPQAKLIAAKNLDFSENDIDLRRTPSHLKRGESMRSNNNDNLCTICFDSVPNAVIMDCGHGGLCYECALELWKKSDSCILCRQRINKILKIVNCRPLNTIKVVESTRKVVEKV